MSNYGFRWRVKEGDGARNRETTSFHAPAPSSMRVALKHPVARPRS